MDGADGRSDRGRQNRATGREIGNARVWPTCHVRRPVLKEQKLMYVVQNAPFRPVSLNRAAACLALIFVVCLPMVAANFQTVRDPHGEPLAGDYPQDYIGGYIVLHGDSQRFYDPQYAYALQHDSSVMGMTYGADRFLPIIYPPFYYLLIAPLAMLPYYTSAVV
jgi:hypothetical protein